MDAHRALVETWNACHARLNQSAVFRKMAAGTLTRREYAAILRQIFHHARENPQLQALATARFRGEQRGLVKMFCKHAIAEVGHDQLALNDLAALGEDVGEIPFERPLPATFALLASAFHMIEHHNPVAYVGYLFHLEYTPVQVGARSMDALAACGIPREAMGFLAEHAHADVAHCRLLRHYADQLVRTEADLADVLYMQRITAEGYERMLEQAVETADAWDELSPPSNAELRQRRPAAANPLAVANPHAASCGDQRG